MTHDSQAEVTITSKSDGEMELLFPPNMRLHKAEFGKSWSVKREGNKLRTFSSAGPELRKILSELQVYIKQVYSVAGDYCKIKVRYAQDQDVEINILRALIQACREKGFRIRYENLCLTPSGVQPRYAV